MTTPVPSKVKIKCQHNRAYSNTQNLIHKLNDRESAYNRRNVRGHHNAIAQQLHQREFYKSIVPNLTIQNVDKPHGYLRKFTPDGRMLLAFSNDQLSLHVWRYSGIGSIADLLQNQSGECITAADETQAALHIRQNVYHRLFQLCWNIRLTTDTQPRCHLNREFSIFFEDGKYVLLAAMGLSLNCHGVNVYFNYPDLCDDFDLFQFCFYVVNLETGKITSRQSYRNEYIMLSHNHGVAAYGNTIAILSMYRQCIMLLELINGELVPLYEIGPFGTSMDASLWSSVQQSHENYNTELPLSHFKQRILAYLYAEIMEITNQFEQRERLREFYKKFRLLERMLIAKIQLIDSDCLLLRYEERPSQIPMERTIDQETGFKLYVFYAIKSCEIIRIYQKDSIELLYLLRNYCDTFRNVRSLQTQRPSSSPSNNTHFRAAFNSMITSVCVSPSEAAIRFNPTLPISTQSFATSQYLDYSLFNYDDRLISALERPKIGTAEPICFSDRNTNLIKFRLFLEQQIPANLSNNNNLGAVNPFISAGGGAGDNNSGPGVAGNRDLVAFIFHPFEPFIISIQKLISRYVVNFHVYNAATVVRP